MDGITISTERITTAGAAVTDVGGLLAREIATMGELLAGIRSGWQSDTAAPRFAATMQGYLDQAIRLKDTLISHGTTLQSAGRQFALAENDLAQGMGGVRR